MFGDLTKRVLMVYKADTASAQADIKKLSLTQKEHASALKKDLDTQNIGLEAQIGKYASYAAKAVAAYAAIKVGIESMEYYYDKQEIRERAQGHSMEALRAATRGLVSETELLKLAGASNNGVMKLSSDQLVTMTKAMDVLGERGYDTAKVMADFHDFLQTGKAKVLKDYGFQVDEARGSMEQLKQIMEQASVVAGEHASLVDDAGDSWARAKVTMGDSLDSFRESVGRLMDAVSPILEKMLGLVTMVIEGWSQIFELGADVVNSVSISGNTDQGASDMASDALKRQRERWADQQLDDMIEANKKTKAFLATASKEDLALAREQGAKIGEALGSSVYAAASRGIGTVRDWVRAGNKKDKGKGSKGGSGKADVEVLVEFVFEDPSAAIDARAKRDAETYAKRLRAYGETTDAMRGEDYATGQFSANIDELPQLMQTAEELQASYAQFNAGRTQSVFREMFGDPEEINLYASGFNMLKDASVAAFQAVMTGSMSAGAAFKKMMASQMMTLASTMFGRSIYEAAAALGSLAGMDYRGAAAHGAAAAKYAAGAILLGSIAASMGGGGSAATGGAGGNASVGPSTRSAAVAQGDGAGSGRNISIIVGDDFADDSPRKRQQKAERLVKMGLRSSREVVFA